MARHQWQEVEAETLRKEETLHTPSQCITSSRRALNGYIQSLSPPSPHSRPWLASSCACIEMNDLNSTYQCSLLNSDKIQSKSRIERQQFAPEFFTAVCASLQPLLHRKSERRVPWMRAWMAMCQCFEMPERFSGLRKFCLHRSEGVVRLFGHLKNFV